MDPASAKRYRLGKYGPTKESDMHHTWLAMLNTRNARGSLAQGSIEREVTNLDGQYVSLKVEKGNVPLPLGWMLSPTARQELDRQVEAVLNDPQAGQFVEAPR